MNTQSLERIADPSIPIAEQTPPIDGSAEHRSQHGSPDKSSLDSDKAPSTIAKTCKNLGNQHADARAEFSVEVKHIGYLDFRGGLRDVSAARISAYAVVVVTC